MRLKKKDRKRLLRQAERIQRLRIEGRRMMDRVMDMEIDLWNEINNDYNLSPGVTYTLSRDGHIIKRSENDRQGNHKTP